MSDSLAAASPLSGVAARAGVAVRYLAIAIGFTLPISTALDNVLLALLLACWLASGHWRAKYATVRGNPVALAALAYLALMALGLLWSPDPLHDGLTYLRKYSDLLLIPILVTVFTDPQDRRRGLLALAAAIALTLLASLALSIGALPTGGFITGEPANPTVFKKHITQNILMAFGCLLFAELARRGRQLAAASAMERAGGHSQRSMSCSWSRGARGTWCWLRWLCCTCPRGCAGVDC